MRREKGKAPETRREYNARFGEDSPDVDWPEEADYLWDAFHDVARDRQETQPLGLLLIRAHYPHFSDDEIQIIRDMDSAWLNAFNAEMNCVVSG